VLPWLEKLKERNGNHALNVIVIGWVGGLVLHVMFTVLAKVLGPWLTWTDEYPPGYLECLTGEGKSEDS
jgi:hypothetical protein